jgi:hypothetical protein
VTKLVEDFRLAVLPGPRVNRAEEDSVGLKHIRLAIAAMRPPVPSTAAAMSTTQASTVQVQAHQGVRVAAI